MLLRIKITWLTCTLYLTLLSSRQCSKVDDLPKDLDDARIGSDKGALHIIASSQCNRGFLTFQAWAQKYTLEMVNQPGKFTRVVSCDHPEEVSEEDRAYMDTLIVPDWSTHPTTGDYYTPYNRPVGLVYWLAERKPTAEWTLLVDPDMLFAQPFLLKDFEVPEGYAAAARYDFMKGVHNGLADIYVPQVKPRQDENGGPAGRKADMAGAFYLIRTKDLVKLAPLWLKFTEDIRNDPHTKNYTGDGNYTVGDKEWVAEMYGYAFAAAALDIWHKIEPATMYYPVYVWPRDIPIIVHYGQDHTPIGDNYKFLKYEHTMFDVTKCPPWNLSFYREEKDDNGLFPHPPFPDVIPDLTPREKYAQLLIVYVGNSLNQALCARHRKRCPPSVQLARECGKVDAIAEALKVEFDKVHVPGRICYDDLQDCKQRAEKGECETRGMYMRDDCRASCNWCRTYIPRLDEIRLPKKVVTLDKTQDYTSQVETLKNQESVSREILYCQELNLKSLAADFTCRRLARAGFISLDESKVDEISFEQRTILLRGSSTVIVYSVLILAVGLVGAVLLIRKYLGASRRTSLPRHQ